MASVRNMEAGRLNKRITIQEPVMQQQPHSGSMEIVDWKDKYCDIAAEIVPLSVKEFIAAKQINSEVQTRITIRHRPGISPTHRILFKSRYDGVKVFQIYGSLDDNQSGNEWISLACSEGVMREDEG